MLCANNWASVWLEWSAAEAGGRRYRDSRSRFLGAAVVLRQPGDRSSTRLASRARTGGIDLAQLIDADIGGVVGLQIKVVDCPAVMVLGLAVKEAVGAGAVAAVAAAVVVAAFLAAGAHHQTGPARIVILLHSLHVRFNSSPPFQRESTRSSS